MLTPVRFLNSSWKINLVLLLSSFSIYCFYFGDIFLQLNSLLSSNTLDSLKNYYTFVYHIQQDDELLHFAGMNFPYGEHIVYTDCQPMLSFLLRLLPFAHPYLIGILHALLFLSFIVSPLILFKIFGRLNIDRWSSFFISLGIALLAPQFVKINGGHYALAYGCIIPYAIYLLLTYLQTRALKTLVLIFLYNCFLFSLHPYLGFCGALFTFISLVVDAVLNRGKKLILQTTLQALFAGILPLVLFKFFMVLTDHHPNRPEEPFGAEVLVENLDSLLAPEFGPFQSLLESLFPNRTLHYEGHSYLGFAIIVLSCLSVPLVLIYFKKIKFQVAMSSIFIASLFLLFLAFGLHNKLFDLLHIQSLTFKQLRATSRFAWYFYYTLPLFVIPPLYHLAQSKWEPARFQRLSMLLSVLIFISNLTEAHYFFQKDQSSFWNCRNVFNPALLNQEEKLNLQRLHEQKSQAIVPLPVFHGGSEFYDKLGFNNSMLPAMLYSFHSGLPILSSLMSRTSIEETENSLSLLNSYRRHRAAVALLNGHSFFVLKTNDALLPDEERLTGHVHYVASNDSLQFGFIEQNDFLSSKKDSSVLVLPAGKNQMADSSAVVYIHHEDRKPFIPALVKDYEHLFKLDSNQITSGDYVLSIHYYFEKYTYRAVACDLIVTRDDAKSSEWFYILPVRYMSGFYPGYGVVERSIYLDRHYSYGFMLKGGSDLSYRVSDVLLRPKNLTVVVPQAKDTLLNNFPIAQ